MDSPPLLKCGAAPGLPPPVPLAVHHTRVVPTLRLASEQSLSDSSIALLLLLVLHSRLQDTRVRKIN